MDFNNNGELDAFDMMIMDDILNDEQENNYEIDDEDDEYGIDDFNDEDIEEW